MKNLLLNGLILIFLLSIIISCTTNPTANIQGVYEVDKESLRGTLQEGIEGENALAIGMLNVVLENAVIELCIKGDSINGILFMAGEATIIESQITLRNDSLILTTPEFEAHLIQTETGISYQANGSDMSIKLNKTDRVDLLPETKKAIETQKVAQKEEEKFEQNLGIWQEGNYVDEFGDRTGEGYAFCLIRGTNENSISTQNEVYVKAMVEDESLFFQIYNSSFSMKETFPDSKFGIMKMKYPSGKVESERIFFYDNSISEAGDQEVLYNYISKNEGLVKVFIDLSTASKYYSDKYQFSIERKNLTEILAGVK